MIIYNVLSKLFSAPTSVALLRELSFRTVGMTGRELARLCNIAPQAAHNALANLEYLKIVKREFVGRSHSFTINQEHFLYKNILIALFEAENEFTSSIFSVIKKSLSGHCVSVILFGSVARKEEKAESDLDICIVYESNRKIIEETISVLRDKLNRQYGVALAPFYITESDFRKKAKLKKPPINSILNEGKVLFGKSINRLIHG